MSVVPSRSSHSCRLCSKVFPSAPTGEALELADGWLGSAASLDTSRLGENVAGRAARVGATCPNEESARLVSSATPNTRSISCFRPDLRPQIREACGFCSRGLRWDIADLSPIPLRHGRPES